MTRKILFSTLAASIIFFAGCSSKQVDVAQKDSKPTTSATSSKESSTSGSSTADAKATAESEALEAAKAMESANGILKAVLFDYDKFTIRDDMMSVVDENIKVMTGKKVESAKIKLEGNADERGSDEYNFALALKRANSVKSALVAKGIADAKISTVTLGEGNPVCKEHNEECWQKNRRAEFKLEK